MSRPLITPKSSNANKKRDWINCIVQLHDLQCGCCEPLEHTIDEIIHQEPTIEKYIYKKCLTGTEKPTTDPDADVIGDVDLEALFAQDDDSGEKDTAATTSG